MPRDGQHHGCNEVHGLRVAPVGPQHAPGAQHVTQARTVQWQVGLGELQAVDVRTGEVGIDLPRIRLAQAVAALGRE